MILQSLHDLYDRLADHESYGLAKPGYSPQKISFRIIIKPDGSLFDIKDARLKNDKGKPLAHTQLVLGEAKPPGAGINPCLLWDNTSYMLGYKSDDKKPERTLKSFHAYRERHLALEKEINTPIFSSVCRFLENWDPARAQDFPELAELDTGFGLFQIQGNPEPIHLDKAIITWWEEQQASSSGEEIGQCLITGTEGPIARLHPKIKSVAGAQSAGASIVSFNDSAYESYGKSQSYNAPVSEIAAFKYGTVLNSLLSGPQAKRHRLRIGDTTCVYWTNKSSIVETAFNFLASEGSNTEKIQDEDTRSKVETFLKAVRDGSEVLHKLGENPDETKFFILGLAPNAARLSIRFFHQSSVAELLKSLRAHQKDISIVREYDKPVGKRFADPEFPANWQILKESARVSDEIPPLLGGSLMRAILEGTPYPEGLYSAVIRRIHLDRTINYFRAAIIKGVLTRNHKQSITIMLDTENKTPAYLLGRLFSALEKTQEDALGNLNSGLRDKFYSSASATPASVFPRIIRTYQHHLAKMPSGALAEKIGKDKATAAKVLREILIQDILSPIESFPSNFNLRQQGTFALGYYHQRKAFFTKKEKAPTE